MSVTSHLKSFERPLVDWIGITLTPADVERIVPLHHRLRTWVDFSGTNFAKQLLDVIFGSSDDLTLLALVQTARIKDGDATIPEGLDAELATALAELALDHYVAPLVPIRINDYHAFLSYAHADASRAVCLAALLSRHGVTLFRDIERMTPGQSIAQVLAEGMARAQQAIVLVSASSAGSRWVDREIRYFLPRVRGQSCRMLPILIDDVPLPDTLADLFTVDLRGYRGPIDNHWAGERLTPLIEVCLASFAAAAVLLQRLENITAEIRRSRKTNDAKNLGSLQVEHVSLRETLDELAAEKAVIVKVLLSVLKDQEKSDDESEIAMRKHIAEIMFVILGCIPPRTRTDDTASPLAEYDLQNARLRRIIWQDVNLRHVELFNADLREASFRGADLRSAVLYAADLEKSVLIGAKLEGADLRGAKLAGARLAEVTFDKETRWTGATYDEKTQWPDGLDPVAAGAIELARAPTQTDA